MIKVAYCGKKPSETDHTYGTGLTWLPGDVHEVSPEKWALLKKHADVWCEYAPPAPEEPMGIDIEYALSAEHSYALRMEEAAFAKAKKAAEVEAAIQKEEKTVEQSAAELFQKMTDEEVRAYVKAAGGKAPHHKLTGENLRTKALEALKEV